MAVSEQPKSAPPVQPVAPEAVASEKEMIATSPEDLQKARDALKNVATFEGNLRRDVMGSRLIENSLMNSLNKFSTGEISQADVEEHIADIEKNPALDSVSTLNLGVGRLVAHPLYTIFISKTPEGKREFRYLGDDDITYASLTELLRAKFQYARSPESTEQAKTVAEAQQAFRSFADNTADFVSACSTILEKMNAPKEAKDTLATFRHDLGEQYKMLVVGGEIKPEDFTKVVNDLLTSARDTTLNALTDPTEKEQSKAVLDKLLQGEVDKSIQDALASYAGLDKDAKTQRSALNLENPAPPTATEGTKEENEFWANVHNPSDFLREGMKAMFSSMKDALNGKAGDGTFSWIARLVGGVMFSSNVTSLSKDLAAKYAGEKLLDEDSKRLQFDGLRTDKIYDPAKLDKNESVNAVIACDALNIQPPIADAGRLYQRLMNTGAEDVEFGKMRAGDIVFGQSEDLTKKAVSEAYVIVKGSDNDTAPMIRALSETDDKGQPKAGKPKDMPMTASMQLRFFHAVRPSTIGQPAVTEKPSA